MVLSASQETPAGHIPQLEDPWNDKLVSKNAVQSHFSVSMAIYRLFKLKRYNTFCHKNIVEKSIDNSHNNDVRTRVIRLKLLI